MLSTRYVASSRDGEKNVPWKILIARGLPVIKHTWASKYKLTYYVPAAIRPNLN